MRCFDGLLEEIDLSLVSVTREEAFLNCLYGDFERYSKMTLQRVHDIRPDARKKEGVQKKGIEIRISSGHRNSNLLSFYSPTNSSEASRL